MAEVSAIEWTDATWNPWQGCTKVSPACANCYMFRDMKRYGRDPSVVNRSKPPTFNLPLKKRNTGQYAIAPGMKVFTCSWSDWFHKDADAWRDEAWAIVRQRPDLIFQIVTKRTDRIAQCLPADWGNGYPNVWLIATVENQEYANLRVPQLLENFAVVHGVSCEPIVGRIDLSPWLCQRGIGWVIAGGESGPQSRPMHPEWATALRDQCEAAGVPFLFKQWGEWVGGINFGRDDGSYNETPAGTYHDSAHETHYWDEGGQHEHESVVSVRVGKKAAGRLLDGREWNGFPMVTT